MSRPGTTPASEGSPRLWRRRRRPQPTPLPQHETPDLDVIREVAHEMVMSWSFHEVAIAEPFQAETMVHEWGRKLVEQVGWPKGWVMYE